MSRKVTPTPKIVILSASRSKTNPRIIIPPNQINNQKPTRSKGTKSINSYAKDKKILSSDIISKSVPKSMIVSKVATIPPNNAPIISNRIKIKFVVDNSSSTTVKPENTPLKTSFDPNASAKS